MPTPEAGRHIVGLDEMRLSGDRMTVAVIIPAFNHARFLADAIVSVLAQTRQPDEVIVVDDGSTDDPKTVVGHFPTVRMIRQDNRGLSAARNTGLNNCKTSHVIFLDADDRLLPNAIESGLAGIACRPDCAFTYGGHRLISENGYSLGPDILRPIDGDPYLALLRRNLVGAIMTVLFRRDRLLAMNGFDESLRRCEDYDLYLRIAQRYPVASHAAIVAEYRKHGQNMSENYVRQLKTALRVLDRQEACVAANPLGRAALQEGRTNIREFYVFRMLGAAAVRWRASHHIGILVRHLVQAARWSPLLVMRTLLAGAGRRAKRVLPRPVTEWIQIRGRPNRIPIGSIRFGDLKRLSPISNEFGSDRGTPIDRYYIEAFLADRAADIQGHVLELSDNLYTRRYGGTRVERSDVLAVEAKNPHATIVGDLVQSGALPEAVFDCVIFTQALQFIFDVRAAVTALYRALKPGGILLVTVPGVTKMADKLWPWYWAFTETAIRRLLADQFGEDAVLVEAHGNIFAATGFLYGISLEELDVSELNKDDPGYPVIVTARAVKRYDS